MREIVDAAKQNRVTAIIASELFLFTIEFPNKNAAKTMAIEKTIAVKLFFIVV